MRKRKNDTKIPSRAEWKIELKAEDVKLWQHSLAVVSIEFTVALNDFQVQNSKRFAELLLLFFMQCVVRAPNNEILDVESILWVLDLLIALVICQFHAHIKTGPI